MKNPTQQNHASKMQYVIYVFLIISWFYKNFPKQYRKLLIVAGNSALCAHQFLFLYHTVLLMYHFYRLSLYYHIRNYLTITYFEDKEKKSNEDEEHLWTGVDITFELSPTMQFSIFKGSQKGGLVCANGICAEQPSFEDGIKLTFRALF